MVGLLALTAQRAAGQAPRDTVTAPMRDTIARLPALSIVGAIAPGSSSGVGSGVPARIVRLEMGGPRIRRGALLSDALSGEPSVAAYDDLGSPFKRTLVSRGFAASPVVGVAQGMSVFLDGMRVNEPEAAQVNFDLLPMSHVERVELLSGAGTLLGRNSLGGAVNLVTTRGDGPRRATVDLEGGSFGQQSASVAVAGVRALGWSHYLGGGRDRERGWRQATAAERDHLLASSVRGSDRRGGRLFAYGARSLARTAGSLPESIYRTDADSNLSADDYEDLSQLHLAASGWLSVGRARVTASMAARRHAAERFNRNQPDDPDVFSRSRNESLALTADVRRPFVVTLPRRGAAHGEWRAGIDGALTDVRIDIYRDSAKFGRTRERSTLVTSPGVDAAAFAIGDVTLHPLTLSAGLRVDHVRSPYENRLDPSLDTVNTFSRASVRIGATAALSDRLSLHASYGQAFRAPSTLELACSEPTRPCPLPFALGDDPPLAPVVVDQYEVGVRWTGQRLAASASWYRSDVRNDIYLLPAEVEVTGSSIDGYFANIARTRRAGGEVAAQVALPHGASLVADASWTNATFRTTTSLFSLRTADEEPLDEASDDEGNVARPGDRIPLIPDAAARVGLVMPVGRRLTLAGDVRHVGRRFLRGDEANETTPLASYRITDLRATWALGTWEVAFHVANVFDGAYEAFGGFNVNQGNPGGATLERFLTPGEPRRVRLSLRRTFGGAG